MPPPSSNRVNKQFSIEDLCIKDGKIVSNEDLAPEVPIIDCHGLLVVPGLVDLHTHVYHDFTVLGVEPDQHCLQR